MRLFAAIRPPAAARAEWSRALAPLRDLAWPVRWVHPEALHITLHFFGNVEPDRVPIIGRALRSAAALHEPLLLRVRGLDAFPSRRSPRVIWFGVAPDPRVLALQRDVVAALEAAGFPRERRRWSPHVTVARATRDAGSFAGVDDAARAFRFDSSVPVEGIDLMSSTPSRERSLYERIETAVLGAG